MANLGTERNGTALLIKKHLIPTEILRHSSGRITSANINKVCFTSIYAPSGNTNKASRDDFFRIEIPTHMAGIKTPFVIAGDFNAVDHSEDRNRMAGTRRRPVIEKALIELVAGLELVDIWKTKREKDFGHTYIQRTGSARLDRMYSSRSLCNKIQGIQITPTAITDHSALWIELPNFQADTS